MWLERDRVAETVTERDRDRETASERRVAGGKVLGAKMRLWVVLLWIWLWIV